MSCFYKNKFIDKGSIKTINKLFPFLKERLGGGSFIERQGPLLISP